MRSGAKISECGGYRYRLWREWRDGGRSVCFIMLNPSTADAETDDPTIRRCVRFAKDWGYGRLDVVNLYPLRATKPAELKRKDPFGPGGSRVNRAVIAGVVSTASKVVAAWGAHAKPTANMDQIIALAQDACGSISALGFTKSGQPRHPLMLRRDTMPEVWNAE